MGNVGQVDKQRLENDVRSLKGKVSRADQDLSHDILTIALMVALIAPFKGTLF